MTLNGGQRPDVERVLSGLKDFQRQTVDYVFRRLYTDDDRVSRFLIADEVGLGKTLVARGIIAKAVDLLWDDVPRIDVVYICSNQDIAQQNIDRLTIGAEGEFHFASRATLLPMKVQELKNRKLNFVSLTPGTSFNLRSQGGWSEERRVLYALLGEHWGVDGNTLSNVLRGWVTRRRWKPELDRLLANLANKRSQIDAELAEAFQQELKRNPAIRQQYEAAAAMIGPRREHLSPEMRSAQNALIGELRRLLARSSLSALQPDLVILDEFQRFKYLLEDEGDVALLARELFGFPNAKVLLLSATPYKMYTLEGEAEDHYADFYRTVEFLLREEPEAQQELKRAVERYRSGMLHLSMGGREDLLQAKAAIEAILRRVMVRTERLAASADRNGMLVETLFAQDQVHPGDLTGFVHLDRIARQVDAGDQVEYWKSSAYALNLMDSYILKRKFADAPKDPKDQELVSLLLKARKHLLDWETIQAYEAVDPGNARLRAFRQQSVETGNWQLLWMPASLPYYQPGGPFRDVAPEGCTKSLVFSGWKVVPKTIAMLLSYEAERKMLEEKDRDFSYDKLTEKRKPLLTFTRSRGRLTGMPVFCLTYPCAALALAVDPLRIARNLAGEGTPSSAAVFEETKSQVSQLLRQATASKRVRKRRGADERWYWAALALLDRHLQRPAVDAWLSTGDKALAWQNMLDKASDGETSEAEEGESRRYAEHVQSFTEFFQTPGDLGAPPDKLVDVLAHITLSSPAVVALRAALRMTQPGGIGQWPAFLAAAARIGLAFRTLFNQPDAISLIQSRYPAGAYWEKALRYSVDGNLQAVMDEYMHILYESLGLVAHDPVESVTKLGKTASRALSLSAQRLHFDEVVLESAKPWMEKHPIRCRYALRFGDESADYENRTRDVDVRVAFNSPFRPFVLATTSIGQEGLDFHQYCHRVVHWNLPSNPVDLEQREGRVHRYKGHVIRRNLALNYGLGVVDCSKDPLDPWEQLFEQAIHDRPPGVSDLIPFWVYEAGKETARQAAFKIERRVPVLPLSREIGRMEQLKRSLVAYRSVIGQPRQQELLEFLSGWLDEREIQELVSSAVIDLSPPRP